MWGHKHSVKALANSGVVAMLPRTPNLRVQVRYVAHHHRQASPVHVGLHLSCGTKARYVANSAQRRLEDLEQRRHIREPCKQSVWWPATPTSLRWSTCSSSIIRGAKPALAAACVGHAGVSVNTGGTRGQ